MSTLVQVMVWPETGNTPSSALMWTKKWCKTASPGLRDLTFHMVINQVQKCSVSKLIYHISILQIWTEIQRKIFSYITWKHFDFQLGEYVLFRCLSPCLWDAETEEGERTCSRVWVSHCFTCQLLGQRQGEVSHIPTFFHQACNC